MKFENPATLNPIDQLKVIGLASKPHRRSAQNNGHCALRLRAARRRRQSSLWLCGRRRHRQGTHHLHRSERRRGGSGRAGDRHGEELASSPKATTTSPKLLGGPENRALSPSRRARRCRKLRTGTRSRAAHQVNFAPANGAFRSCGGEDFRDQARAEFRRPGRHGFPGGCRRREIRHSARSVLTLLTRRRISRTRWWSTHASIAAWNGDKVTIWTSSQMIDWCTTDMAKALGIAKEKVRLRYRHSSAAAVSAAKLGVLRADALLAALGARAAETAGESGAAAYAADNQQHHPPADDDDPAHPHRS